VNPALIDPFGRPVTRLRVSVTDRCNLSCFYCRPRNFVACHRSELLSFEEIERVVRVAAALGVAKVRLTGGEPLARAGVVDLARRIASLPGIEDLALSTNGLLLAEAAARLRRAGVRRVNVSLDTLRPERFQALTGAGSLWHVLEGIRAASRAGLEPVKLNTVVIRGVNDDELLDIVDFARSVPAQPRFIEYMPLVADARWQERHVGRDEILARLRPVLAGGAPRVGADPATYYRLRDGSGEVGVISPVSCQFCRLCDRLRLTADGRLRPCLTREGEVDLKGPLRGGASDEDLALLLRAAVAGKPGRGIYRGPLERPMVAIGG
jgi:cyclic pyranopterin phosphate synthase